MSNSPSPQHDLSLMSWNILAPCWVAKEWYPVLYDLAADHPTRLSTIISHILSLHCDVVFLQEVQDTILVQLEEKLRHRYTFQFIANNPTTSSEPNGLLTMIRKDWKYASEAKIIEGILDPQEGEAIQIIQIPSKRIHLVNVHLHWVHQLAQGKMVLRRCEELLGDLHPHHHPIAVLAGDLNGESAACQQFGWTDLKDALEESDQTEKIPTYYPDPSTGEGGVAIDHIYYDPRQVKLLDCDRAWQLTHGSLAEALKLLGSDHIFVWAKFDFIEKK